MSILQNRKVLIADDDPYVVKFLFDIFTTWGWGSSIVCTGRELYLLLSASNHRYDLVVADVNMPDWSGPEGVEMANTFGNNCPVIYITGDEMTQDIPEPHLLKPFSLDQLSILVALITKEA